MYQAAQQQPAVSLAAHTMHIKIFSQLFAIVFFVVFASSNAYAQNHNVGDYYDDGETLYLIASWYDPAAPSAPGPDDDLNVAWSGGGGGGGGGGGNQTEGSGGKYGASSTETNRGTPLPAVVATAQRRPPQGSMRVFFSIDLGRLFGRRNWRPGPAGA